jgi:hypothetical protein
MAKTIGMGESWDFFDHDGAKFRRPASSRRGRPVTDVLHGKEWVPYEGNTLDPALFGDRISDPLGDGEMVKADAPIVLFLKAKD